MPVPSAPGANARGAGGCRNCGENDIVHHPDGGIQRFHGWVWDGREVSIEAADLSALGIESTTIGYWVAPGVRSKCDYACVQKPSLPRRRR
jgi:hypothetical protein